MRKSRYSGTQLYKEIVFSNLGKKCSFCFNTKNLVVHHKDQDYMNNKLDNLLLLCRKCHGELHSEVGLIYMYLPNISKKRLLKRLSALKDFLSKDKYSSIRRDILEKSK